MDENVKKSNGSEMFTSIRPTRSDKFATIFGEEFKAEFQNENLREDWSDGDLDKERNFYVLKHTKMPAILTENFFMDNERECKQYLMTNEGRDRIAQYHVKAIQKIVSSF